MLFGCRYAYLHRNGMLVISWFVINGYYFAEK